MARAPNTLVQPYIAQTNLIQTSLARSILAQEYFGKYNFDVNYLNTRTFITKKSTEGVRKK